jgi:hypothetical protein
MSATHVNIPAEEVEYLLVKTRTDNQKIVYYSILGVICTLFTTGGICFAVLVGSRFV